MKLKNPFVTYGYSGSEYFCDRVSETQGLISAIENERNVTLMAPRRYGKTGLIKNSFEKMSKDYVTIYIDIYSAVDLAAFTDALAHAAIAALDTGVSRLTATLGSFFKSLRPTVTPQSDGTITYSFDIQAADSKMSLDAVFKYLAEKSKDRRIVIAIDEFQQVRNFPEKGVEALLRSYIQFLPFVKFIFAGSQRHLMMDMFSTPQGPFYQSTQIMDIGVISEAVYESFARRFFSEAGQPFNGTAFAAIYRRFSGITWYVQAILNKIWETDGFLSSEAQVAHAVETLCGENEGTYHTLLESQNEASRKLLLAIAAEGCVSAPTGFEFVHKHNLRGASTVSAAMKDLLSHDLVYKTDSGIVIYDRLFGIWMAHAQRA